MNHVLLHQTVIGLEAIKQMELAGEDPDVIIFLASADGSIPEQRMTYRLKEDKLVLTLDGIDTAFFRVK